MPRQTPPDVLTRLVAAFEQTGNVSEAARIAGVPRTTARDMLRGAQVATRRQIHARACEAGLRQGRRAIRAELVRCDQYIAAVMGPDPSTPLCEPRDYAILARAKADVVRTIIACDERVGARRQEHLTRQLSRAKLETLRGLGADLSGATDEELATVRAILERARSSGPTPVDPERAGGAEQERAADGDPR
jgi:hypothetical protein